MGPTSIYTISKNKENYDLKSNHTFRIQNHDLKSQFLLFFKSVYTVCIKICVLDIYNKEYVNSKPLEILLYIYS